MLAIFCIHFFSNLAKFQLCSIFLSWLLFKNVILRYRDFKARDPFLAKIGLFSADIFINIQSIQFSLVFYGLVHGDT